MNNLENLKRQHTEIFELMNETTKMIAQKDLESNGQNIAKNISSLAGKLKMHLGNEDKFMYPSFLMSKNEELKKKATEYIDEMGDLSSVYMTFKDKYNTRTKILNDQAGFMKESAVVFKAIEKRIKKEDSDLYVIAAKL